MLLLPYMLLINLQHGMAASSIVSYDAKHILFTRSSLSVFKSWVQLKLAS